MIDLDAIAKAHAAMSWFSSDADDGCGEPTSTDMVCTQDTYNKAWSLAHHWYEGKTPNRFRSVINKIPYNTFLMMISGLEKLGDIVMSGAICNPSWIYALGEDCVAVLTRGAYTGDTCGLEVFERGKEYSGLCEDLVRCLETEGWVFAKEHDAWWVKSRIRLLNGERVDLDHSSWIRPFTKEV